MSWTLFDTGNIVALLAILGLFYVMLRYRKRPVLDRPERDLAYEWVAEPADRADQEFLAKFGDAGPREAGVTLIRIGFFNTGTSPLRAGETIKPLAINFADGVEILLASFGDCFRNESRPGDPAISGARVEFPPFDLAAGGAAIFNLAIRGDARPRGIEGSIEGIETIRRMA